jgi:hypothetical protein
MRAIVLPGFGVDPVVADGGPQRASSGALAQLLGLRGGEGLRPV